LKNAQSPDETTRRTKGTKGVLWSQTLEKMIYSTKLNEKFQIQLKKHDPKRQKKRTKEEKRSKKSAPLFAYGHRNVKVEP